MQNRDGRPSAFARVYFETHAAAKAAQEALHMRTMEDWYVEVFLYTQRPGSWAAKRAKGGEDDAGTGSADGGWKAVPEVVAPATKEQVAQECR